MITIQGNEAFLRGFVSTLELMFGRDVTVRSVTKLASANKSPLLAWGRSTKQRPSLGASDSATLAGLHWLSTDEPAGPPKAATWTLIIQGTRVAGGSYHNCVSDCNPYLRTVDDIFNSIAGVHLARWDFLVPILDRLPSSTDSRRPLLSAPPCRRASQPWR